MDTAPLPTSEAILLLASCAAALLAGIRLRPSIAETTLVAPWTWAMISCVFLAAAELLVFRSEGPQPWISHIRYATACVCLSPTVALLGAKRPQSRAWQFVVISLLAVLWLPSVEGLAFRPSATLELHAARRWFVAILVLMVLVCYLPTRNWLASILTAAGQITILGAGLPAIFSFSISHAPAVAALLFCGAAWSACYTLTRATHLATTTNTIESAWRDFHTAYGWLWSIRTAERLNITATRKKWELRITSNGRIETQTTELDPRVEAGVRRVSRELLRRFVSKRWIAERFGDA